MPLIKSASNRARETNVKEMIAAGHDPRQSVAAAYRNQRQARSRRKSMSESSAHAPGHEISGERGAIRQRQKMGQGKGPMAAESFGVGPLPGTATTHNHGEHMPHDGVHLHDDHRAGKPAIHMGDGQMHATAHSHMGPHHHSHGHHHKAPEGTQPHHIGGAHHTGGHHKGKRK